MEIGEACGLAGAMEFESSNGAFGEDPRDLRTLPAAPTLTSTRNNLDSLCIQNSQNWLFDTEC